MALSPSTLRAITAELSAPNDFAQQSSVPGNVLSWEGGNIEFVADSSATGEIRPADELRAGGFILTGAGNPPQVVNCRLRFDIDGVVHTVLIKLALFRDGDFLFLEVVGGVPFSFTHDLLTVEVLGLDAIQVDPGVSTTSSSQVINYYGRCAIGQWQGSGSSVSYPEVGIWLRVSETPNEVAECDAFMSAFDRPECGVGPLCPIDTTPLIAECEILDPPAPALPCADIPFNVPLPVAPIIPGQPGIPPLPGGPLPPGGPDHPGPGGPGGPGPPGGDGDNGEDGCTPEIRYTYEYREGCSIPMQLFVFPYGECGYRLHFIFYYCRHPMYGCCVFTYCNGEWVPHDDPGAGQYIDPYYRPQTLGVPEGLGVADPALFEMEQIPAIPSVENDTVFRALNTSACDGLCYREWDGSAWGPEVNECDGNALTSDPDCECEQVDLTGIVGDSIGYRYTYGCLQNSGGTTSTTTAHPCASVAPAGAGDEGETKIYCECAGSTTTSAQSTTTDYSCQGGCEFEWRYGYWIISEYNCFKDGQSTDLTEGCGCPDPPAYEGATLGERVYVPGCVSTQVDDPQGTSTTAAATTTTIASTTSVAGSTTSLGAPTTTTPTPGGVWACVKLTSFSECECTFFASQALYDIWLDSVTWPAECAGPFESAALCSSACSGGGSSTTPNTP